MNETIIIEVEGKIYTTTISNPEEDLKNEIIELENKLKNMVEPTDSELIELGKIMHPYYMLIDRIKQIKQIKQIT